MWDSTHAHSHNIINQIGASHFMSTWYASYIPLLTTTVCYGQVNSETLQTIFNFKLCLPWPTSKPPTACHLFLMQPLQNFGIYI